jgi:DNA-binding response OmpR family regulator
MKMTWHCHERGSLREVFQHFRRDRFHLALWRLDNGPHPDDDVLQREILLQRRGRVVSKSMMTTHLSSRSSSVTRNAIEVYVHRLRKVLEYCGADVQIHTVRGVGYMIGERHQDQEIG